MYAKRGRIARLAAVAVLGLALSACGGGAESDSGAAAAAQNPAPGALPGQGSTATQGPTSPAGSTATQGASTAPAKGSTPTQGSAPAQGSAPGHGAPAPGSSGAGGKPPAVSAVTIDWTPPTENTDGTTLENLAGYKIHYGTASKKYTQTISVRNPGLVRYVISSLSPGTYYFSVTAYNSAGTESPFSSEVSARVE